MLRHCSDTNLSSLQQTGTKEPEKRGGYGETHCHPNVGRAHAGCAALSGETSVQTQTPARFSSTLVPLI